jgi:uncharacterized protein involved in type VI secretion and phage assembly
MSTMPRSFSTDTRYFGVSEALVTHNDDPKKQGRVRVKFPWFDAAMESDWCRVANLYAGNGYGAFWIPEVGDEVLVAFQHGDMRFPYVLGGLYNGKDLPSTSRNSSKNQKLFRTKGGHSLLFDDSSGQAKIEIKTKGGHSVVLNDASKEVTITSSGGQSLVMNASGAVKVKGVSQVTLDAPKVNLGGAASSSLVLGEALLIAFNTHTHNCTAPGTPSGPPVPPMTSTVLSTTNKTS